VTTSESLRTAPDTGLPDYLAALRRRIESALHGILDSQVQFSASYGPLGQEMARNIRSYVLAGGKRIRGTLVLEGYRVITDEPAPDSVLPLAVAMELLHAFLLMHDDIIDQDELRRGQPTFHERYRRQLSETYPGRSVANVAEAMAIMAGDLLCGLAQDLLVELDVASERRRAVQHLFNRLIADTGYGEILDVLGAIDPTQDEASMLMMYRLKTARYSFEGPLLLGATVAGASQPQHDALSAFGIPLGVAFQLQDDLIGMFGTEAAIGKPVGSDLKEGKRTPLMLHALAHTNGEQHTFLERTLGQASITGDDVCRVASILVESGSRSYIEQMADTLVNASLDALTHAPLPAAGRAFLAAYARSQVGRNV